MISKVGSIALLGSGETSLAGGRIYESLATRLPSPLHVAVLEIPAGFELNSSQVAGRVGEYLANRLKNYSPLIEVVPARKRGTDFSPDNPEILEPLLRANMIFMGAGSPTYTVRQLSKSLAWDLIRARHRQGAVLLFASAATIAIGARTLPVYEIYKVGEEITCPKGLDIFADFGLSISCIPHWNNTDGGDDLDTSRCYIGLERFNTWCNMLPPGHTTLGLDEHTGLVVDFSEGTCAVSGISSVTLLRECNPEIYPAGRIFSIKELGEIKVPDEPLPSLSAESRTMIDRLNQTKEPEEPPSEIVHLLELRQHARVVGNWVESDSLRQRIIDLGWSIQDTRDGQIVKPSR